MSGRALLRRPELALRRAAGFRAPIASGLAEDLHVGFVRRYVERLREEGLTDRLGIIIGVGPVRSAKSARWMNENLFGVHVPDAVIERLERASEPAVEGQAICAELIDGLREIPGVAGAHIMAPGGGTNAIAAVLDRVSA